ncbi:MAG: hypothetical protein ACI81R_003750, partial [Bradymonadia bacterium]
MPSNLHSLLVQLFAAAPRAVLRLVPELARALPESGPIERRSEDFTVLTPAEYRADLV